MCFFVLWLLFMNEATGTLPLEHQHKLTEKLFRAMSTKERGYLHDLLAESYAVGYYDTLDAFSHATEIAHLKTTARESLGKLKRGSTYRSILHKAGGKRHLEQYLNLHFRQGKKDAHVRNLIEDRRTLRPRDVLYHAKEKSHTPALDIVRKILAADNLGKITFVALLALLAVIAIVGLIGAYCFPHLPGFRKVRSFLES